MQTVELKYTFILEELVGRHGYQLVAERLGVTEAAVRHMLSSGRDIYVKRVKGKWCYAEVKEWKHAKTPIKKAKPRTWQDRVKPFAKTDKVKQAVAKPLHKRTRKALKKVSVN